MNVWKMTVWSVVAAARSDFCGIRMRKAGKFVILWQQSDRVRRIRGGAGVLCGGSVTGLAAGRVDKGCDVWFRMIDLRKRREVQRCRRIQ